MLTAERHYLPSTTKYGRTYRMSYTLLMNAERVRKGQILRLADLARWRWKMREYEEKQRLARLEYPLLVREQG